MLSVTTQVKYNFICESLILFPSDAKKWVFVYNTMWQMTIPLKQDQRDIHILEIFNVYCKWMEFGAY